MCFLLIQNKLSGILCQKGGADCQNYMTISPAIDYINSSDSKEEKWPLTKYRQTATSPDTAVIFATS